jgi:hypothetical protein
MADLASMLAREGYNSVTRTISDTFSVSDNVKRPNNATAYAANQAINCNLTVTEVAYTGLVVTLKAAAHGLLAGDRITVGNIDGTGTPVVLANINGNWIVSWADTDHIMFTVLVQPTGTTPTTGLTLASAISKQMSFDVGGVVGGGIILSMIKLSLPGKAMTGAVRMYVDDTQVATLVDATTYPLAIANQAYRKTYFDFSPIVENASSDCTVAVVTPNVVIKCAATDTRLYIRLVAEASGTPTALGVVSVQMTGIQLLG